MRSALFIPLVLVPLALLSSCSPSGEASREPTTKESLYQRGHRLYETMELREAELVLKKAATMDSLYVEPLVDLAGIYYDIGAAEAGAKNPLKLENFRLSRRYFVRVEQLGYRDPAVYERLCELCVALEDDRGFLKYAQKNFEKYPFDRQYYNLGLALFGVADWQGVVKTQKEGASKFAGSQYVGGYYRQMGRAYMKLGRDQTAERTFATGVQAVNECIAGRKKNGGDDKSSGEERRLTDDKIGMLLLLKRLHTTYRAADKLERVEKQLKEAGYSE